MSSKFTFIQDLGSGTYGRVVKVKKQEKELALKIYNRQQAGIYSSLKEVDILFRVNHPNLIKGHELCTKGQESALFKDDLTGSLQELMRGSISDFEIKLSLDLELDSSKRYIFYLKLAKKLLFSLTSAAAALNKAGYLHLDIKPENILYQAKDVVESIDDVTFFLGDYGLCIPRDSYTEEQWIAGPWDAGTYLYLPPEALKKKTLVNESSSCWMIALSVIEFLTTQPHYDYIKYNESEKHLIASVRELALETRQKTLDNFDNFYKRKPFSEALEREYLELSDILSKMLFINYKRRIKPSDIETCQIKEMRLTLKHSNDFIKAVFKTFLKITKKSPYTLREACMAWTLACKMMSLNRISGKADIKNELNKCLEFSIIFYTDMQSSDLEFLKPEKKIINYMNEIKGCVFDNDLYIKSGSVQEIKNILKTIILDTDKFRDKLLNGFETSTLTENKNADFEPEELLKLF